MSLLSLIGAAAAAPEQLTAPVARAATMQFAQADSSSKEKAAAKSKSKTATEKPRAHKAKAEAKSADKHTPASKTESKAKAGKSSAKTTHKTATKPASHSKAAAKPAVKPEAKSATSSAHAPKDDGVAAAPTVTLSRPSAIPAPANTIITAAAIDVAAVKRAVEMVRRGKQSNATEVRNSISDPAAKKLVEWVILRSDDPGADFSRFVSFIDANPDWPSIVTLRRKAEATAFQDKPDNAKILAFFNRYPPLSAKGRFALARALLAAGKRKEAEAQVREAYRYESFSQEVESRVLDAFGDMLTRADHKARMDRLLYDREDADAGLRAANRLGGNEPAIAKARIAMLHKGANKAALDAVPTSARDDIGYKFSRIRMLRRSDHLAEAVALLKTVPKLDRSHDLDEWWRERRVIARDLLDAGDPKEAYLAVRDATPPESPNYRAEHEFMAGWIALRYLHDAAAAHAHFLKVAEGNDNPISLARGAYWTGRAAEALHHRDEARARYQEAARYPTAYYGQIARAKAGQGELALRPLPTLTAAERNRAAHSDIIRAAELLYAIDARDLAWVMMADLGDKSNDNAILVLMAELAAKYKDARGMLLLGKLALARGLALDHAAFPTIGVPSYTPIGPPVDAPLIYSIVRQESWFNPKTISSANALGLMQVTPEAGKYIARKFKGTFDQKRLLSDQSYNVQMGSAELGDDLKDYRGSYIMAFAAYNAGRGRVRQWVARYGDPRDPKVDPIDWVERIPIAETRNYVQRVMENFQIYRIRFGGSRRLLIEADLRRGAAAD